MSGHAIRRVGDLPRVRTVSLGVMGASCTAVTLRKTSTRIRRHAGSIPTARPVVLHCGTQPPARGHICPPFQPRIPRFSIKNLENLPNLPDSVQSLSSGVRNFANTGTSEHCPDVHTPAASRKGQGSSTIHCCAPCWGGCSSNITARPSRNSHCLRRTVRSAGPHGAALGKGPGRMSLV